ncbi:hypothetical protein C483_17133 [Natrialba hulunbeirensis JCM 10989]|uniref:Uncharacterized protein n=1 Tax=Natrialba hulunbeirensis JCM 10989 TaxID=1227493 RepID=L9ZMR1_9EURY|nr:hypothetical protein [Natrialba hulunbeirensis]ELY87644.1 hypothetical protein C483_17133 [Natrialba hulunbeirensis JCM 10989]
MVSQESLNRLKPFIDEGETTIDGYSTSHEIGVLTDRQLLSLEVRGRENSTTVVDTTYLDQLGGVSIEHNTTPDFHQDKLLSAIVSLVLALISLALFGAIDAEGPATVLLLVGLGVGVLSLVLFAEAFNTPEDTVHIQLQTDTGETAWQARLDEEYLEFAETLSRTVSSTHATAEPATRTIGG